MPWSRFQVRPNSSKTIWLLVGKAVKVWLWKRPLRSSATVNVTPQNPSKSCPSVPHQHVFQCHSRGESGGKETSSTPKEPVLHYRAVAGFPALNQCAKVFSFSFDTNLEFHSREHFLVAKGLQTDNPLWGTETFTHRVFLHRPKLF